MVVHGNQGEITFVDAILRRGLVLFIAKEAMSWQWYCNINLKKHLP
jgi:hypothetical protein